MSFSLVKNMAPSTVQKLLLASEELSMAQIALWKPFQFFLRGISFSGPFFGTYLPNILQ
jgi:hypothetical protein